MPFRLYIDEVGNDDLGHVNNDLHRYLSLSGVAMDQDYARDQATPVLNALKARIFQHDPDTPVIFHRKDIMNRRGVFHCLKDETVCADFDESLVQYFTDVNFTVITVVIDKLEMMNQDHWQEKHPYHYLMMILVEKYVQWLERQNGTGDIMPEMRRGIKDRKLQLAYDSVRIWGSDYVDAKRIKKRIPSSKLKFRCKDDNITGLQICDLIAHPSHMHVRSLQGHAIALGPFANRVLPVMRKFKYDRSWWGKINGYGIKYLP
jgi:hypothetical protein